MANVQCSKMRLSESRGQTRLHYAGHLKQREQLSLHKLPSRAK